MSSFLINILLALLWTAVNGSFTIATFGMGFLVGYGIMLLVSTAFGRSRYHVRIIQALRFFAFYIKEVILSSLRVAHDVLTPRAHMNPGVIALKLDARSAVEITALANLISLTPGSLTMDVSRDRRTLYFHAMYIDDDDVAAVRRAIKRDLESRIMELFGTAGERE